MGALALIGVVAALLNAGVGAAAGGDEQALAFERFMQASRPICRQQPADACIRLGWALTDADGDQGLSLAELTRTRGLVEAWAIARQDELTRPERSSLVLGLLLADSIGLDRLLALYDTDQDGLISRAELLVDVRLDQRPLGEVLLDPQAVDRAAIARRLGLPPALVEQLQP